MRNYAVIKIKGQQFKVEEGQELLVNKLDESEKPEPEVLMIVKDGKAKIGNPILKDAKVTLKKLENEKGKKLHVYKYKSKSRYRRKLGSRQEYTCLSVSKIA